MMKFLGYSNKISTNQSMVLYFKRDTKSDFLQISPHTHN